MKKIFLLLMIVLLCSCSVNEKEEEPIEEDDDVEEAKEIVNVYNYDNLPYEPFKPYEETFNNNVAWTLDGDGTFVSNVNKKSIIVNSGVVTLNSSPFMMKNGNYNVSFSSSARGHIKIASNDEIYLDTDFESGNVSFDYQVSETNYEVVISLNFDDNCDINDFSITCDNKAYGALINQVTYLNRLNKQVVFNNNPGNYFGVYSALDDSLVYVGNASEAIFENGYISLILAI